MKRRERFTVHQSDLVTDPLLLLQERFQVKNPPSAYLEKLKSFLDHGGNSRKVKHKKNLTSQFEEWFLLAVSNNSFQHLLAQAN